MYMKESIDKLYELFEISNDSLNDDLFFDKLMELTDEYFNDYVEIKLRKYTDKINKIYHDNMFVYDNPANDFYNIGVRYFNEYLINLSKKDFLKILDDLNFDNKYKKIIIRDLQFAFDYGDTTEIINRIKESYNDLIKHAPDEWYKKKVIEAEKQTYKEINDVKKLCEIIAKKIKNKFIQDFKLSLEKE